MESRWLGQGGLMVSGLGLGCMGMSFGHTLWLDREGLVRLLRPAVEQGVTFFDTAGIYGQHAVAADRPCRPTRRDYGRRMTNRVSMFLLGATLALGFTMAAYLLAGAIRSVRDESGIKVKGYAETTVKADTARWRMSITARAKELKDCYDKLAKDTAIVRARLVDYGFAEAETNVFAAQVAEEAKVTEKGTRTNEIEGYRIVQAIEITTPKPDAIDKASKRITEVLAQGVQIISEQPQFTFTKLEGCKLDLLGAASRNAYERATTIASKAGGRIGRIRSASQGVFQIVPVGSTETSDYGAYDTSTIDKVVKAVVTIDFMLER